MGVQWLPVLWKTEIFLVRACSVFNLNLNNVLRRKIVSNSPFPWGDNVENTDYEDMNLGSIFHNESESTLDASILKPKRKRMRSRM